MWGFNINCCFNFGK